MSIQYVQILRLPVYDVSDGKVTTGEGVDKGMQKEGTVIRDIHFALRR